MVLLTSALVVAGLLTTSLAAPLVPRNAFKYLQKTSANETIFSFGDVSYLATTGHPETGLQYAGLRGGYTTSDDVPITVISTNASVITSSILQQTIAEYLAADDVLSADFTQSILITTSASSALLDASASDYLASYNLSHVFLGSTFRRSSRNGFSATILQSNGSPPSPGPYLASITSTSVCLSKVYRLYTDTYRDFLYGAYEVNDGTGDWAALDVSLPSFGYSAIPVPSRLYSWNDPRPFAGFRVAIKDLFDLKGLKTTGGSQAWQYITTPANTTAPSIQRILDLGGVIVGKFKLAQFASGANPWDWTDEHYPFNPRGDGWLTCSASSSGGGCSIAAYDWLDYAIGSDTGSSMRRPAAVSGTYGQRPSQGMISLEGVMPLGGATDTAGVFSRDPFSWVYFSKHWYTPTLHQPSNITGLSALQVPDTDQFPKTILYPTDYLPLNNSAAEPILDAFIANLSSIFGMTVKRFNFTDTVQSYNDSAVNNLTALSNGPLGVINSYTQWEEVGKPLTTAWASLFDGRFPPVDLARRPGWRAYNETAYSLAAYNAALVAKNAAVEWYETHLQYSTPDSCSESVMLYDIGTGGLPSYREQGLNNNANASFLAVKPPGAAITGAGICPLYGCADFTIPIGQVPYFSQVTFHEEMVPVTINMVMKRGCDFVLYNMIERLADAGVLKTVKTGRTAY